MMKMMKIFGIKKIKKYELRILTETKKLKI